jgi:hypothetical protein
MSLECRESGYSVRAEEEPWKFETFARVESKHESFNSSIAVLSRRVHSSKDIRKVLSLSLL